MRVAPAGGSDVADGASPAVVRGGKVCLETLDAVCKRPDGAASRPSAAGIPRVLQVVSRHSPAEGMGEQGVAGKGGKRDDKGAGRGGESAILGGVECCAGPADDVCAVEFDTAASVDEQKTMEVDENENAARSSRGIFRKKNQIIRKGSSGLVPLPGGRVRDDDLELTEVEGEAGEKNGLAEDLGDGQGLVAHERGGDDDTLTLSVDIDQVGDAESPVDDASVETGALIMQGGLASHSYALSTPPTVRVSGWDANTGDLTPDTKFLVGQGKLRRGSAVLGSSFKGVECDSFVATPRSVGAGEEEEIGLSRGKGFEGRRIEGVRRREGRLREGIARVRSWPRRCSPRNTLSLDIQEPEMMVIIRLKMAARSRFMESPRLLLHLMTWMLISLQRRRCPAKR